MPTYPQARSQRAFGSFLKNERWEEEGKKNCMRISFKSIIIKSDTKNDAAGVERFWCKYC